MRRLLFLSILFFQFSLQAQVASSNPALPLDTDEVVVTFDVTKGSGDLGGYTGDVYVHTGVLTESSTSTGDWKYVMTGWGENTPETKLTRISTDLYELTISPNIRDYYGVPTDEKITTLAFVLRSGEPYTGTTYYEYKDEGGKDIFVEVFEPGLQVSIISPAKNLLSTINTDIAFEAEATETADLSLFLNNIEEKTLSGTSLTHTFNFPASGDYWVKVIA
ncbi:MAG: hypothetical protein KAI17_12470, partial [Thiotrichaceae bacterium]|nr:hypothetical protein [Thiotrichaceae bacterium]